MAPEESSKADLNALNHEAWELNAAFWNERLQQGNPTHELLLAPAIQRLLDVQVGERILDIACGGGQDARRLARLGAHVTAFDFSHGLIEYAKDQSREEGLSIDFRVVDATDAVKLRSLGPDRFDGAICNMALMDIPVIEPLAQVARELLRTGGRLVFSVTHPCFNTAFASQAIERSVGNDGQQVTQGVVRVSRYKTPSVTRGEAIVGQPRAQLYFDRPMEDLLGAFFNAGFVMDALEEPAFGPGAGRRPTPTWKSLPEIPPVLVVRMRSV